MPTLIVHSGGEITVHESIENIENRIANAQGFINLTGADNPSLALRLNPAQIVFLVDTPARLQDRLSFTRLA